MRLWARAATMDDLRRRIADARVASAITLLGSGDIVHRNVRGAVSVPRDDNDDSDSDSD